MDRLPVQRVRALFGAMTIAVFTTAAIAQKSNEPCRRSTRIGASIAVGWARFRNVSVVILAALFAACDAGPSEADFIEACLWEGRQGANKALRREMGVKSDDFCKCAAAGARSSLSADARQAMILDMQGKSQEARQISSKMTDAEQMAFMKNGIAIFGRCARAS
jgi:hypothetical protein